MAYTLGPDDGQAELRRWQLLNESATPSAQVVTGSTVQVRYQPGPGVQEELTDLAAAEQTCHSFVSWSVINSDGQPVLRVSTPANALDAVTPIAARFGAAETPCKTALLIKRLLARERRYARHGRQRPVGDLQLRHLPALPFRHGGSCL